MLEEALHLFLVQQKDSGNGPGACLELACNISCSRNKLDTIGIHFCSIKNELVQIKGTNLVQQIEDHAPKSFTRIIRRVRCNWHALCSTSTRIVL